MRQFIYSSLAVLTLTTVLSPSIAIAADKVIATVNKTKITEEDYNEYLRLRQAKQPNPKVGANRKAVINELINRELLYQAALKEKLEKDPEVSTRLKIMKKELLMQAAIGKSKVTSPVTDEELKKEYDKNAKKANVKEYKARHILVKTEDEAKAIIVELDKGEDFAELAKEKSTGPSGKKGGNLGWFNPSQMVPPFSQATSEMKKGAYSKKPVKTRFGWHIIKLEDTRKIDPPKFADVKQQLRMVVQNKRLKDYIDNLRKNAKVTIK